jgi:hypothetical protein
MGNRITFFSIFFIFILSSSCNPARRLTGVEDESFNLKRTLTHKLDEKYYPRYILTENAELSVKGDQNINGRLTVYIEKDKSIFLMGRFLGFEAFRFELTNDSVKYINRLKAEYFYESISKSKLPSQFIFSLKELQILIYSGIWNHDTNNPARLAENFKQDENGYVLSQYMAEGQKVELRYTPEGLYLKQLNITDYVNGFLANADFYRSVDKLNTVEAVVVANNSSYNVSLLIGKIDFKEFNKTSFNIGKNYKRLESLF